MNTHAIAINFNVHAGGNVIAFTDETDAVEYAESYMARHGAPAIVAAVVPTT